MNTHSLLTKLSKNFPKRLAVKNHDHVGLMWGKLPKEVHKIVLCLDFDETILDQVKAIKPDMILTHHPFIFGSKSFILKHDLRKKALCEKLDELGIPVYSMHTNFDEGKRGMNDALTNRLGLINIYAPEKAPMMRIGELKEPMEVHEFAKFAKESFKVDYGLLIDEGNKMIKKVGIIGGGGSRSHYAAMMEGCDIYISGDAPHYVRRDIVLEKFNYLDLPHEIEKIFMPAMKEILLGYDSTLDITIIDHEQLPKVI